MRRPLAISTTIAALVMGAPATVTACMNSMYYEIARPVWVEGVASALALGLAVITLGAWLGAIIATIAIYRRGPTERRLSARDVFVTSGLAAPIALVQVAMEALTFSASPDHTATTAVVIGLLYGVPALIGAIALRQHLKLDGWPREKVRAMRWISALVVCIAVTSFGFLVKSQTHFEPIEQASFDVDFGEVTF